MNVDEALSYLADSRRNMTPLETERYQTFVGGDANHVATIPLSHSSHRARDIVSLVMNGGSLLSWKAHAFRAGVRPSHARVFFDTLDCVFLFLGAPWFGGRVALVFGPDVEDRSNPDDRASPWDTGGMGAHTSLNGLPRWHSDRRRIVDEWSFPVPAYRGVAADYLASHFAMLEDYLVGRTYVRPDSLGAMAPDDPLTRTWEIRFRGRFQLQGLVALIVPAGPAYVEEARAWAEEKGIDVETYETGPGCRKGQEALVHAFLTWLRRTGRCGLRP